MGVTTEVELKQMDGLYFNRTFRVNDVCRQSGHSCTGTMQLRECVVCYLLCVIKRNMSYSARAWHDEKAGEARLSSIPIEGCSQHHFNTSDKQGSHNGVLQDCKRPVRLIETTSGSNLSDTNLETHRHHSDITPPESSLAVQDRLQSLTSHQRPLSVEHRLALRLCRVLC